MTDPTTILREAIRDAIWPPMDEDPEPELDEEAESAADDVLATRIPQACQTCKGSGKVSHDATSVLYGPVVFDFDCEDCPTIGTLLLWGWNVAKAEHDDYTGYTTVNGRKVAASGTLLAALREVPQ